MQIVQRLSFMSKVETMTAERFDELVDEGKEDVLGRRFGTPLRSNATRTRYQDPWTSTPCRVLGLGVRRKGRSSQRTAALFRPISRSILAMEPGPGRQSLIYAEMLKKADELAADRETRVVAAAQLELPSVFWLTITFLLVILLVLATFTEATLGRAMALGGLGFGIALLVALVFAFDEPFKGETSVSPKPIINAVAEMQARKE